MDVSVDLAAKSVTCSFSQQKENSDKYCSIEYGLSRENCRLAQNEIKQQSNSSTTDNVLIVFPFNEQFQPQEEYCFTVTASNGTFTALIEGTIALDMC